MLEVVFNVAEFHIRTNLNEICLSNPCGDGEDIPNTQSLQYKLYRAAAEHLGVGVLSIFRLVFGSAGVGVRRSLSLWGGHAHNLSHLLCCTTLVPWISKGHLVNRAWCKNTTISGPLPYLFSGPCTSVDILGTSRRNGMVACSDYFPSNWTEDMISKSSTRERISRTIIHGW